MKKFVSLFLALMLFSLPVLSLAETAAESPSEEESGDIFDALRIWYYESGAAEFNSGVAEFFVNGAEVAKETMQQYVQMAEDYLKEIYPEWDEETKKAWATITEAAQDTTAKTKEEVTAAWAVIKAWMEETGETMSEGTQAIFDAIGSAAGVADAKISSWLRVIETFIEENKDAVTEDVQAAWSTIKENALEAGSVAEEKLNEAYITMRSWLDSLENDSVTPAQEALDGIQELSQSEDE